MAHSPADEYGTSLYMESDNLKASHAKRSATGFRPRHDTPITQDYGYSTPPSEPCIANHSGGVPDDLDARQPSPIIPASEVISRSDTRSTQATDDVETLAGLSLHLAKLGEHLAAQFDRSPKPYARRKAAMLREPETPASSYFDVAGAMYDRACGREPATLEPLAPAAEDAALVAQLTEGMTSSQAAAVTALFALKPSGRAQAPTLKTRDRFLPTRLACASVKLVLADKEGTIGLGQFAVDLCGEAVWKDRLQSYLEPPVPESNNLGVARFFLEEAICYLTAFDEDAASDLREIVDGLA
ncbi:hypothetical protein LTR36_006870 [Oleoguttula mirabilis]|uniref:Uncharacterized protein n=1 Tax=Oleoguttula mirabilis TaxID=1507867 RepID=A0AAV9JC93_9PEZI|nr:hypothetical protein LTR36_006870 [Oleoguttula mirabilis]